MVKKNINYRVYENYYNTKASLLKRIPKRFVTTKRDMSKRLQIGVTTYIDRYDEFFKPLYLDLLSLFPEIDLHITVNGFFDQKEQNEYLRRMQSELCLVENPRVTFVMHDHPVGLTRLWNEILCQSKYEYTLILNDDLRIFPWFRKWIESEAWISPYITLVEGTWSNFFISQQTVERVGWFDEGYEGIGFEDMDYTARCVSLGATIGNIRCPFIQHRDHKPTRTSYDQNTTTVWGPKYSTVNQQYFFSKWRKSESGTGIYIKQIDSYVLSTGIIPKDNEPPELRFQKGLFYPDRDTLESTN